MDAALAGACRLLNPQSAADCDQCVVAAWAARRQRWQRDMRGGQAVVSCLAAKGGALWPVDAGQVRMAARRLQGRPAVCAQRMRRRSAPAGAIERLHNVRVGSRPPSPAHRECRQGKASGMAGMSRETKQVRLVHREVSRAAAEWVGCVEPRAYPLLAAPGGRKTALADRTLQQTLRCVSALMLSLWLQLGALADGMGGFD